MAGTFYRLTNGKLKIDETSKMTDWILPYQKKTGSGAGRADFCPAHAHSVFRELDDIIAAAHLTPWLRNKSVGEITVTPEDGDLVNSPSTHGASHHSWWPSRDVNPNDCVVVREKHG